VILLLRAIRRCPANLSPWSFDLATTPNADNATNVTMLGILLKLPRREREPRSKAPTGSAAAADDAASLPGGAEKSSV
jgi:hypothetical protein